MPWLTLLLRNWKAVTAGVTVLVFGILLMISRHETHKWQERALAEATARATDKAAYRAAQAQAQQMETARLVRVQADYERNNADAKQGYARDIADLNVRYQRLRTQERTRAVAFGAADHQPMSEATPGACRAFGATCTDELLAALRDAEETAIRLVALQGLVKRQAEVPVN